MNKDEFKNRMELIDTEQKKAKIPIYARQLNGLHLYCEKYKTSAMIAPLFKGISDDPFDSMNLAQTIFKWYETKYGEKIKKDFSLGSIAILLAGDIYCLKIPQIFGNALIYADGKFTLEHTLNDGSFPLNIISYIENITNELTRQLSPSEEQEFLKVFNFSYKLFKRLHDLVNINQLCFSAKKDFESAVHSLLETKRSIGQSKWSSLQATEKIIKYYIKKRNKNFNKRTHNLELLFNCAYNYGLPVFDQFMIKRIQCSPNVRYGEEHYSLEDAIQSHHYSLFICSKILENDV